MGRRDVVFIKQVGDDRSGGAVHHIASHVSHIVLVLHLVLSTMVIVIASHHQGPLLLQQLVLVLQHVLVACALFCWLLHCLSCCHVHLVVAFPCALVLCCCMCQFATTLTTIKTKTMMTMTKSKTKTKDKDKDKDKDNDLGGWITPLQK